MKLKNTFIALLAVSSILNSSVIVHADTNVNISDEKNILDDSTSVNTEESIVNDKINITENSQNTFTNEVLENTKELAKEIFMEWIYDNSTFYIGADIEIEANVNKEATVKEVGWKFTGDEDSINSDIQGNKVKLTAKNKGKIEVMAYAIDGSLVSREIMLNIDEYPTDETSKSIIGMNIMPIQTIKENGIDNLLQVEVNKSIEVDEKIIAMDEYLKKLSKLGNLGDVYKKAESDNYAYYTIRINDANNTKLEIRVDKNDDSYISIKDMIVNANLYNDNSESEGAVYGEDSSGNEENFVTEEGSVNKEVSGNEVIIDIENEYRNEESIGNKESNVTGNIKEEDKNLSEDGSMGQDGISTNEEKDTLGNAEIKIPETQVTQGVEEIVILGGVGVSEEKAVIVGINDKLNSKEKIKVMDEYLNSLNKNKNLKLIRIEDTSEYRSYVLQVFNKRTMVELNEEIIAGDTLNDFFIEIRVDKNDKESYESIISMLDKIDKDDDKTNSDKDKEHIKEDNIEYSEFIIDENKTQDSISMKAEVIIKNILESLDMEEENNKLQNTSLLYSETYVLTNLNIPKNIDSKEANILKGIEENNFENIEENTSEKQNDAIHNEIKTESKDLYTENIENEDKTDIKKDSNKFELNKKVLLLVAGISLVGVVLMNLNFKKRKK